jgi:hypothetical protein
MVWTCHDDVRGDFVSLMVHIYNYHMEDDAMPTAFAHTSVVLPFHADAKGDEQQIRSAVLWMEAVNGSHLLIGFWFNKAQHHMKVFPEPFTLRFHSIADYAHAGTLNYGGSLCQQGTSFPS